MARTLTWHRVSFDYTALASGVQGQANLLQNVPVTELVGVTIQRIIIQMVYSPGTSQNVNGAQLISLGVGIVSEESFNAQVVPDPNSNIDEPASGWLYRGVVPVTSDTANVHHPGRINVDLRAQRKMGRAILAIIHNNDAGEGSAFTVRQSGLISVLVMNP